jgi:hypothetical protein
MAIQGLRDTTNFVNDQRPKNWREGIMLLYPNGTAPLFALSSMMKSAGSDDPEYNWWEKDLAARTLLLTTTITAGTTSLAFSGGGAKFYKEGDLFFVPGTAEIVQVSQDPVSDTALSVLRGAAGSTAAAVTLTVTGENPMFTHIGSAYEEGSLSPTGIGYDPTKLYNYTQIFRDSLEATRTAMKTRLRTGDSVKEAKRECLETHSIGIERAFWFGKRSESVKNGKPIRTTGGVLSQIPAGNVLTPASAVNGLEMQELEVMMASIFAKGSSEKMVFSGNLFMLGIQQAIRKNTAYQFMSGQKEFGMNVSRLVSPFGELILKTHPQFNQMPGGTSGTTPGPYYGVNSWGFVLDMANIRYRYVNGDDTRYEAELQQQGMDGKKSGYLTECGLQLEHASTHFVIKNVVKGKADA